jgi:hypothetical protein
MQAKQREGSLYQDPGVDVPGSSRTRTSGTTRDRAPDPQGPGPEPRPSVHEQANEGGRIAKFGSGDHRARLDRGGAQ